MTSFVYVDYGTYVAKDGLTVRGTPSHQVHALTPAFNRLLTEAVRTAILDALREYHEGEEDKP